MKKLSGAVLALILMLLACAAWAQEARDITDQCTITTGIGSKLIKRMLDDDYSTYFSSSTTSKAAIEITLPQGETAGGVYIKWWGKTLAVRVQVHNGNDYETIAVCDTPYLCDYIPLPEGINAFRILQNTGAKGRMLIAQLKVYSPGELPDEVQRWNAPLDKADLLVISTHPDDELIFMGGTIPYYAGELGMAVQVAYVVPTIPERRLELLDGLWYCGVRNHPVIGNFSDRFSSRMADIQKAWGKNRLETFILRLYRQFKPEVVVTHDINGEYGHGAHKAVSNAAQAAIKKAASKTYDNASRIEHGVWQVKKLYLHLYENNRLRMDWRKPLNAFGGKTAFDIAAEAFLMHRSQQKGTYHVEDFGPYDNALFGLFFSAVGEDVEKNDFFEHIMDGV